MTDTTSDPSAPFDDPALDKQTVTNDAVGGETVSEHEGGDPLRIGDGLITGSADPGDRSVTSLDARQPHGGVHARSRPGDGALDVPSGLQPDIMENHDDEEQN